MRTVSEKSRLQFSDILLIIGVLFAPMDSLRFISKLGIAELALFLWALLKLSKCKVKVNCFFRFWISFLLITFIGSLIGSEVAPEESTAIPDYFIYVFLAIITVALASYLPNKSAEYLNMIIQKISIYATVWYLILFFVASYISRSFLGATFWFSVKFTGGAENPNKLAVYICEVLFLNVYMFLKSSNKDKWKYGFCILACFFIGVQTQSSMFFVAVFGSTAICLYLIMLMRIKTKRNKGILIVVTVIILTTIVTFFSSKIYHIAYNWIASDSNGLKRFKLFASIGYSLKKSAIFGLGPGLHALNGQWTYHNAYLEILAMSGIVGLIVFLIFVVRLIKACWKYAYLLVLILPLLIFSTGSFAVRNIEFWVIAVFAYSLARIETAEKLYNT